MQAHGLAVVHLKLASPGTQDGPQTHGLPHLPAPGTSRSARGCWRQPHRAAAADLGRGILGARVAVAVGVVLLLPLRLCLLLLMGVGMERLQLRCLAFVVRVMVLLRPLARAAVRVWERMVTAGREVRVRVCVFDLPCKAGGSWSLCLSCQAGRVGRRAEHCPVRVPTEGEGGCGGRHSAQRRARRCWQHWP